MDFSFLKSNKIVPVVVIENIDDTIDILESLQKGGIFIAEITFRTDCAKDAIALATKKFPNMLIGAGTVINGEQCKQAIKAGAKFIVSPGFSQAVYNVSAENNIPYLAGVATPTEVITAKSFGLNVVKFFPAGVFGGVKALKAISSAFPDVKFVPTGGVDLNNLNDFLSLPCVMAVGGSFMFNGTICEIEQISKKAVSIAEGL